MSTPFERYINKLVKEHGTAGTIAKAIGMSLSAFSRGVRLEGSLGVDKLLRLAQWAGDDPSEVLRLAKKGDVADLIEQLYGTPRPPLSRVDDELTALPLDVKRQLLALVRGLTDTRRS